MHKADQAENESRAHSPNAVEKLKAERHGEIGNNRRDGKRGDALRENRAGFARNRGDVRDYPTDRTHDGAQTERDERSNARKSLSKRLLHATGSERSEPTRQKDHIEIIEKRDRHANHGAPKEKNRSAVEEPNHRQQKIWCGNNILDPRLSRNGGHLRIGSPSECFRRGVGGGLHRTVEHDKMQQFLTTWTSPYKKHIEQPMHYGDGPVPEGKIRATLGQCLSRGFAVGSIQKAKKILKRRHEAGAHT